MSCIHGKDTKPEEIVRKYLFQKDSVIGKMTETFREVPTLYYRSIKRLSL